MEGSLILTVTFSSLTLGLHHLSSWSVHLTGCHVAGTHISMGSGTSQMRVKSSISQRGQHQRHFTEIETTMEMSIYTV